MDPIKFNLEHALELAETAVRDRGADFVYRARYGPKCQYFIDGEPACAVGYMFHLKGETEESLLERTRDAQNTTISGLINLGVVVVEGERTRGFLELLQEAQDENVSWGEALEYAKEANGIKAADPKEEDQPTTEPAEEESEQTV